jgi:(E)-benzylidenesuccinyl-CoA hydratase
MIDCHSWLEVTVPVEYEVREGIAVITIDRPSRGNSLDYEALTAGLPDAWRRVEHDDDVAAAVITGVGERYFCSGMDVRDPRMTRIASGHEAAPPLRFTSRQQSVGKPVIAAVNGRCTGGGLMLLADSDIALASASASFDNPGVSIGVAATLGAVTLSRSADFRRVLRMMLLGHGEPVDAATALAAGIVSELVAPAGLMDRAMSLAALLRANSPAAMREVKRVMWAALERPLRAALADSEVGARRFAGHPDAAEGLGALREGRPARWAPYSSLSSAERDAL